MGEERSRLIIRQMYQSMKETMYDARLNVEALPSHARKLLPKISERTFRSYDGTAMFIPDVIQGARVLDIGCGGGCLTFLLSKLVGPSGYVVGVDSSEQFIQLCQEQTDYHMREWGYSQPNCEFIQTDIERLTDFQLEPFDVIVSNGLLCLIKDKTKVFQIVADLLKQGGEFYNSDIFSDVEQCMDVRNNPLFNCYGISDAMVWSDLQTYGRRVGLSDPYLLYAADTFQFEQDTFRQELRGVNYACAVYRLVKLVPKSPDHSAIVTYNGEYDESGQVLKWDVDLAFRKGDRVHIDGYLAETLRQTKYSKYFSFDKCDSSISTARNQNPFQYLSKLRADGRDYPKAIYPMDKKINKFYEDIIGKIF